MLHAFSRWLAQMPALQPTLAYSPLAGSDSTQGGWRALLRGQWRPTVRPESWNGWPAYCVGRLWPRVEACHGLGNRGLWQNLLARFELHQVLCGYAVTGLPQALSGRRFVVWVAASMDGDKQARLRQSRLYRFLYGLQASTLRQQERFVLERASWVFALSPHTRVELLARGASDDRMSVLTCPIDTHQFRPASRLTPRPTIVWMARHDDPRKNTPLLLRAFSRLADKYPEACLVLIGEGQGGQIKHFASELGITRQVEFRGVCSDAERLLLLQQGALFAMPSDQEGLGIAALEAMACGLPVVSTRCGGPEAFVRPGQTGLLVERDNVEQMAEALEHLLRDDSARQRMGQQARRLVEDEYGDAAFAQQLQEVYTRVWPEFFPAGAR